jgi:hypothetical protein
MAPNGEKLAHRDCWQQHAMTGSAPQFPDDRAVRGAHAYWHARGGRFANLSERSVVMPVDAISIITIHAAFTATGARRTGIITGFEWGFAQRDTPVFVAVT